MKYFLLVILLFTQAPSWAQDRVPVTFYLVDGSEINGYVSTIIMGAKSFNYTLAPKGKVLSMKLAKVKRIVTTEGEKQYVYEVVDHLNPNTNKSSALLVLRVLVEGHMSLYHFKSDFHEFYIKPNPEAKGVFLAARADLRTSKLAKSNQKHLNKKFSKKGAKFFLDCPEIVSDIEAGKIDTKNIVDLVVRYNEFKAAQ